MCVPVTATDGLFSPALWSALAATGAAVAAFLAWQSQGRDHRERIRLDLYERRYEIYKATLDFYNDILVWKSAPEQFSARDRFFYAYQQSGFLFSKESGIEALLKQLFDYGSKVIAYNQSFEALRANPPLQIQLFEENNDILMRRFPAAFDELKLALAKYLNFHN